MRYICIYMYIYVMGPLCIYIYILVCQTAKKKKEHWPDLAVVALCAPTPAAQLQQAGPCGFGCNLSQKDLVYNLHYPQSGTQAHNLSHTGT